MDSSHAAAGTAGISASELADRVERGDVFVVDVRAHTGSAQVYGAIRYKPHDLLKAERLILPLPRGDGLIVLYDENGDGADLRAIATKVAQEGYGEIRLLNGGFRAWRDAARRTEEPTLEQPIAGA
ncbi:MAG TPA: rhodanese-like domain-containing protein [Candidatus Baltobacteraceae bacterium]|nr:rhodanese-like domain-containing protein [Candidatus Baltobacteraceae bacterium]